MAKKKTHEQFVEELKSANSNFENIEFLSKYTGIKNRIKCKCKKCNNEWETIADALKQGCGCPKCAGEKIRATCPNCTTNSKLEYFIKLYLDKNKIDYKLHYPFEKLYGVNGGLLSYDFYLPKYNLLIEAQGQQHEKPIDYFGGEKSFTIQKEHDKRKREYALNNKYNFEEIWYYDIDNISDILDSIFYINNGIKKAS